jgi:hypothetical protein
MPEETIHPLRRRMVEDMTLRNFGQRTQQTYIRAVRSCCRYCGRIPGEPFRSFATAPLPPRSAHRHLAIRPRTFTSMVVAILRIPLNANLPGRL